MFTKYNYLMPGIAVAAILVIVFLYVYAGTYDGATSERPGAFGAPNQPRATGLRNGSGDEYVIDKSDYVDAHPRIAGPTEGVTLSLAEREGLVLMREEEKLARDVYSVLDLQWNTRIFSNIAQSEQTHTNAVAALLDAYDVPDPVTDDTVGVFTSPDLRTLYLALVERGRTSLLDALLVGATIEDLDIADLARLFDQTENPDIIAVYENLQRGSRNHLRAFDRQIRRNGGVYEPVYISAALFESIISAEQERGM